MLSGVALKHKILIRIFTAADYAVWKLEISVYAT